MSALASQTKLVSRRRRRSWWNWLLTLLIVGAGAGYWYHQNAARHEARYEARPVFRGDVEEAVLTTGSLEPKHTVAIGTQVSGQVQHMYKDFNSVVHKGEVLATIDPSTYEESQKQAQDDLDSANANLSNAHDSLSNALSSLRTAQVGVATAQSGIDSARVGIASAEASYNSSVAGLAKAKASMTNDELTMKRNQDLRQQDMIAQSDLDTARTAYLLDVAGVQSALATVQQSKSGVDSARVALKSAQTGLIAAQEKETAAVIAVSQARTQITVQEANVKRSESSLRTAIINVGYCTIHSPVDGVVVSRSADPGQTVAAQYSTPTLYTIATDLHTMQVMAGIDESDIADVSLDQDASFTVDAYPDETFKGKVTQVRNASTVTNNVVTYQALVSVDNPKLKLRPGMTANLSLLVKSKKDVLLVPNMALRWEPESGDPAAQRTATPTPTPTPTPAPAVSGSPSGSPSPGWRHHHHGDGAGGDQAGHGHWGMGGAHAGGGHRRPGGDEGGDDASSDSEHKRHSHHHADDKKKAKSDDDDDDDDDKPTKQRIWVLEGTEAMPITIETGITDGSKTEVVSGLQQGQRVIVASLSAPGPVSGGRGIGGGGGGRGPGGGGRRF